MCHRNWKEKMEEKNWEEMQKYKEFDKENFKGIEKFSKIFNRIFIIKIFEIGKININITI